MRRTSVQVELHVRVLFALGAVVVRSAFDATPTSVPKYAVSWDCIRYIHLHVPKFQRGSRRLGTEQHAHGDGCGYGEGCRREEAEDILSTGEGVMHGARTMTAGAVFEGVAIALSGKTYR